MIHWYGGHKGYFDHGSLIRAFDRAGIEDGDISNGGILVVAGRTFANDVEGVQSLIDGMPWVLLCVVSDEELSFSLSRLRLPDRCAVWVQTPGPDTVANRYLTCGVPEPVARECRAGKSDPVRTWTFAGQVTHPARKDMAAAVAGRQDGEIRPTEGFAQGMAAKEYAEFMASGKCVLCPGGPVTPDTFRLHEALELGRLPIAWGSAYWDRVFPGSPFPKVDSVSEALPILDRYADDLAWLTDCNRTWAWWLREKRQLAIDIEDTVARLSGVRQERDRLTVLIPTSPTPSNGDHLWDVVESIREVHPDCEILIMMDGVRPEHEGRRMQYELYRRRIIRACAYTWHNVLPLFFSAHTHQAAMTRHALGMVRTDAIFFVEHDTPLLATRHVDYDGILDAIRDRPDVNMVRLHYDESIHPEHRYLMLDYSPTGTPPMIRTAQWSQRPHIARTEFYRWMIATQFSADALCMIEDKVHGSLQVAVQNGNWAEWGTWVYAEGWPDAMKRSGHSDARGGDSKFEHAFRW